MARTQFFITGFGPFLPDAPHNPTQVLVERLREMGAAGDGDGDGDFDLVDCRVVAVETEAAIEALEALAACMKRKGSGDGDDTCKLLVSVGAMIFGCFFGMKNLRFDVTRDGFSFCADTPRGTKNATRLSVGALRGERSEFQDPGRSRAAIEEGGDMCRGWGRRGVHHHAYSLGRHCHPVGRAWSPVQFERRRGKVPVQLHLLPFPQTIRFHEWEARQTDGERKHRQSFCSRTTVYDHCTTTAREVSSRFAENDRRPQRRAWGGAAVKRRLDELTRGCNDLAEEDDRQRKDVTAVSCNTMV